MQNQEHKLAVLKEIMGLMDDQMMSKIKPKGKPDMASALPPNMGEAAMESPDQDPSKMLAAEPDGDEIDPEMLQKLMDMQKEEDDESTPV
jgi:hypothetical protein